jgi:transglutaminase-like putative cysteine protease
VFLDPFGNRCARVIAPPGTLRVAYENVCQTTYDPEPQPDAATPQEEAGALPTDVLPFLLNSRYCEIDRLSAIAWDLFGKLPPGGSRGSAINRWVFEHVRFGYRFTRPNKTALDTYVEGTGVCRDMTHLAITFCRAMNIPARYATGYLADIDADPDPTPMDFSAFYEIYLGGRWWPMDARHGRARIGRVLMARGRDATDVALITSFGRHKLTKFTVITAPAATSPLPMPAPGLPLARSA